MRSLHHATLPVRCCPPTTLKSQTPLLRMTSGTLREQQAGSPESCRSWSDAVIGEMIRCAGFARIMRVSVHLRLRHHGCLCPPRLSASPSVIMGVSVHLLPPPLPSWVSLSTVHRFVHLPFSHLLGHRVSRRDAGYPASELGGSLHLPSRVSHGASTCPIRWTDNERGAHTAAGHGWQDSCLERAREGHP